MRSVRYRRAMTDSTRTGSLTMAAGLVELLDHIDQKTAPLAHSTSIDLICANPLSSLDDSAEVAVPIDHYSLTRREISFALSRQWVHHDGQTNRRLLGRL